MFLPSGDAALTRRTTAHSSRRAVVVKFSRSRKRNERQGVLVDEGAIAKAEADCAADAGEREKNAVKRRERDEIAERQYVAQFAAKILEQFPSCPREEVQAIVEHACRMYSGRNGRSAAAKDFEPRLIELAVRCARPACAYEVRSPHGSEHGPPRRASGGARRDRARDGALAAGSQQRIDESSWTSAK